MTEQNLREMMRKRLLKNVPEPSKNGIFTSIEDLKKSQWCPEFFKLMNNRMVMGAFRYGKLSAQKNASVKYDNIASIRKRLILYEQTGNLEHLVDCGNLCMIEYMIGDHPQKHFCSIDDGEHATIKK
jgi:hypothetical protein